jgi:hypothetical protein
MTILNIPPWFDLAGFCQQFNIDQSQVVFLEPGRIQLPVVWPQTVEDTLCGFFDPPSTTDERLEAAELMIDLILDTQESA